MYQFPILRIGHLLFWLLYGALEHISHTLYGENHWQGSLFAPMVAMLLTGMFALIYEKTEEKGWLLRIVALSLVGFVTVFITHNVTRVLHYHISLEALLDGDFLLWMSGSAYTVLLLLTWTGLFVSAYTFLQKKAQQEELALIKNTARDAQLQQLLYQLNPHFLFNVLNSIDVAILDKNNETAHQMVVKLSRFLRGTLAHKFQNKVTLEQELTLLSHFVEIEQQRFHQRIDIHNDIAPEALKAFLPPLLLQPLMENAIKFSWQLGSDCTIKLRATVENNNLKILLINPFDAAKASTVSGTNTGLANVGHRLQLLYGDNASLITNAQDGEFSALLQLPLEVAV